MRGWDQQNMSDELMRAKASTSKPRMPKPHVAEKSPASELSKSAPATREYECKLGGDTKALTRAKAAADRLAGGKADWRENKLINVYYDTHDMRLATRKATLRVRKKGTAFIQTVKTEGVGSGAVFDRSEWECQVSSLKPELDKLPADATEALGLVLPGELKEAFRTTFTRRAAVIQTGSKLGAGTSLEIALDTGEVKAGPKKETISECELELVHGDPRDLFEVALTLQQAAGLRVLADSKAKRGYGLLTPAVPPRPVKAAKLVLENGMTVSDVMTQVFAQGMKTMLANERPAYEGTDPEGVHQFRVAIRRMRSAISVFSSVLDPARVGWLKDQLKWCADQMGPARDWDVFIDEILGPVKAAGLEDAGLQALQACAEQKRAEGYDLVRKSLDDPRYASLVLRLGAYIETVGWAPLPIPSDDALGGPIEAVAGSILDKAHRKANKMGQRLADLEVPARHEMRIKIKKLRYAMDYLQSLYGVASKKAYLSSLAALQDDFGHLNDVAVAETLLAEIVAMPQKSTTRRAQIRSAAGLVLGWHARGLHDGEGKLLSDWDRFASAGKFWRAKSSARLKDS